MTYPFKFAGAPEPSLTYQATREWGGFSVRAARAGAGRHDGVVLDEHRIAFYLCPPTRTDCGCDGQTQSRLSARGDFDFVPARCDGYWEDSEPVELISVRFAPEVVDQVAEGLGAPGSAALRPRLGCRDPIVASIVAALQAELETPAGLTRLQADSLAVALSTRLLLDFGSGPGPTQQTLSKPKLRRLLDYVEANLEADLSLGELAAVAGLSIPHLTALFRRTMGQSLHRYVVERRVARARGLLLTGGFSIAEAALACGFAHQSHLARWMRRILGVAPSDVVRSRS